MLEAVKNRKIGEHFLSGLKRKNKRKRKIEREIEGVAI